MRSVIHRQLHAAREGLCYPPARPKRILYFDIDGTLVQRTFGAAKPALAAGRFERAVRRAGFDEIVCVSDAVLFTRVLLGRDDHDAEAARVLQRFCGDTVRDARWFRQRVAPVGDPFDRCHEIDVEADWFYVDDHAHTYLERAGLLRYEGCRRVLACRGAGDGEDVLGWLHEIAGAREIPRRQPLSPRGGYDPVSLLSRAYASRRE